jgi:serine/threonine protein kinase
VETQGSESSLKPGDVFNSRYQIERIIGAGGMGEVYLAADMLVSGEQVALKIIRADLSSQERNIKRFQREVQLTRKLAHKNIARTFDAGMADGRFYFSMEYIKGRPLDELLQHGALAPETIVSIALDVVNGLEAIHDAGVVHRDLKPGNVIIDEQGVAKIMDFGIARPGTSNLTQSSEVLGSGPYMAPELWSGGDVGGASDRYALGAMLYEMATGVVPFDGESAPELMFKHIDNTPARPTEIEPQVPLWLEAIILKLLSKNPHDRFMSESEIRVALINKCGEPTPRAEIAPPAQDNQSEGLSAQLFDEIPRLPSSAIDVNSDTRSIEATAHSLDRLAMIAAVVLKLSVAFGFSALLYVGIDQLLAPYITELDLKGQVGKLWYMRVYACTGYMVTAGLLCAFPLFFVAMPLVLLRQSSQLLLSFTARYSLMFGALLIVNAFIFLFRYRLNGSHTVGPYLLVLVKHVIEGATQLALLIPPQSYEGAQYVGSKLLANTPEDLCYYFAAALFPLVAGVYSTVLLHVSPLKYIQQRMYLLLVLTLVGSLFMFAETSILYSMEVPSADLRTIARIGMVSLVYSKAQLICALINWGALFCLSLTFVFISEKIRRRYDSQNY